MLDIYFLIFLIKKLYLKDDIIYMNIFNIFNLFLNQNLKTLILFFDIFLSKLYINFEYYIINNYVKL